MLAWHCYFDKRSRAFVILTGSSWSKIKATVEISEGLFSRWIVDVRISAFRAALIKYGNIPGERRVCGPVTLAKHIPPLLFRRRKPSNWAIVFCCGMLGGGRWLVIFFNPPTHWLLLKCHYNFYASVTSRRDCWCVLQSVFAWSQFVALLSGKMQVSQQQKIETGENWKAPSHVSKCFPYTMKI